MSLMPKRIILLFLLLLIAGSGYLIWYSFNLPNKSSRLSKEELFRDLKKIVIQNTSTEIPLLVEVANTSEKRVRGLSGRKVLAKNSGMIFIFDSETPARFHMKDTSIPLDILFFDSKKELVGAASMNPCQKDSCRTYHSPEPISYALEVYQGFLEDHNMDKAGSPEILLRFQ